jgi:hypothetical protein
MTNNLDDILNTYKSEYIGNNDFLIDLYSKNLILLNNINSFKNTDQLYTFISLTWRYVNAIYEKDQFNNTVTMVNKSLCIIDKGIEMLNANELRNDFYYGLIFLKGMACYRLQDYKSSTPIFKQLTEIDDKNDNFKKWLKYSKYGQNLWLVNTIWIVSIFLLAVDILFKSYVTNSTLRILIPTVGLIGLISNYSFEYYIKRSFKKSEQ